MKSSPKRSTRLSSDGLSAALYDYSTTLKHVFWAAARRFQQTQSDFKLKQPRVGLFVTTFVCDPWYVPS